MRRGIDEGITRTGTFIITVVSILVTAIWYVSVLDKRIALVEQNQIHFTQEMGDFKVQLLRIGDNSEKIYQLMASNGNLHG